MKETIEDTLNGVLDSMSTDDIIRVWNIYCDRANYDDYIYPNTTMFFEEHYHEGALYDLVKDIFYGRWNASDTLVKYSQQTGHLVSFTYLSEDVSPYDQSSLVDWLIRVFGDDLESIGEFLGEDIEVDEDDAIYTVGDKTYKFCADDDLVCCCDKCYFRQDKSCGASDLYDVGALPQCDEDGMGYRGYWIEVKMIDVDVCPCCDSSNTQVVDAREDDDYKYVEMRCKDCGCQYTCRLVEIIDKVEFINEDGEYEEYID